VKAQRKLLKGLKQCKYLNQKASVEWFNTSYLPFNAIYPAVLSGIDRALNWADFAGMRGLGYAD
jgi:hypothetical protein